ncbi:MAG: histone deacetylase family protein [Pseudomonadota bacterium]
MRVYHAPETADHAPEFFMVRGRVVANEERAERTERLLAALCRLELSPRSPPHGMQSAIKKVHTPRYLAFLEGAHAAWQALPDAGPEVLANVQPRVAEAQYPQSLVGKAGWHLGDLACPIGEHTATAARRAADCALAAATAVVHGAGTAYALTRPPGHHAGPERAAGHCFLNNAAIAAQALRQAGARPAILDIDVHHGNGTQAIFYTRADVLTVSIHTDPAVFYPWFTGHADEAGAGAGESLNRNLPLPLGSKDGPWLEAVAEGIAAVEAFGADTVVLALGLDVHVSDPLGGMAVSEAGIARAGAMIGALPLPMAITQEGGYLSQSLTDNAHAFFRAFLDARPL